MTVSIGPISSVVGAEHGVEDLGEVDAVDEMASLVLFQWKGEDEFCFVHPDVLFANEELEADVCSSPCGHLLF